MKNYRELVPRTPPEGFLDWCREKARTRDEEDTLDLHGLVFEAEWVEEEGIAPLLEERKPRKIKMVHLRCTACGEERWAPWVREVPNVGKADYGFLNRGEKFSVNVFDGCETYCPACGDRVIAKKAAKLGNGYHVSGTAYFLSALLLPDRALALTGWCVERRFGRSGGSYLHAQPYDAYVFTATDCAKLTGWSKQYGGTAGYFRGWNPEWRQPQRWGESWGQETDIFGLTPELVAESQLPHCKLYEYMTGRLFSPNASPAPIAYLRLYQAHPNVETLVTAGLPNLLDELMAEEMRGDRWESNNRGKLALPEIHWKEKRPSAMLGLTREELRQARKQGWGQYFWRLYTRCLAHGEKLTEEDLRNIWYLGDEHLLPLIGRGPVGKSVRYLLHQAEMADAWETAETDPEEAIGESIEASYLLDYWTMAAGLGYDLGDPHVRWPRDLYQAHEAARLAQLERKNRANNKAIRERYRALRYMRLAREYGKSRVVTDLGAGKALELLALPESQREEFVKENDVSGMTREQLRQAIRERDEASVLAARERVRAETAEQSRTKMEEDMKALKALHAAAVETQREKEEALAKAEAELKDLRSRPVEVAVETRDAAPEQIEAAKAEGAKAAEAKAEAELKKLRKELKAAEEQMEEAREAAEKARKLAAASQEEGMVRFKLLFSSAQEIVNRMAEELEQAPEESRDKLRRAMLALADAIRKAVGE